MKKYVLLISYRYRQVCQERNAHHLVVQIETVSGMEAWNC